MSITYTTLFAAIIVALYLDSSSIAALLLLPLAATQIWHASSTRNGVLSWIMLGWLIWVPVTLLWSADPGVSLIYIAPILSLPLAWLAAKSIEAKHLDIGLKYGIPSLLVFISVWGLLQGPNTFTSKPHGPFNDPNTYAALINLLLLPTTAYFFYVGRPRGVNMYRLLLLSAIAAGFFSFFLVASRGAMLGLIVGLPLVLYYARHSVAYNTNLLLYSLLIAMSMVASKAISIGPSIIQRAAETIESGDVARLQLFRSAWAMITENPVAGIGFGGFAINYPLHREIAEVGTGGAWVHNDYLQLWVEGGLPMILLLVGLLLLSIYRVFILLKSRPQSTSPDLFIALGLLSGVLSVLVQAATNFLLYFTLINILIGTYIAKAGALELPLHGQRNFLGLLAGRMPRWIMRTRERKLFATGYALILGILLGGNAATELLLENTKYTTRLAAALNIPYNRYEISYILSILAPFSPTPNYIMATDLMDAYLMTGSADETMRRDAFDRFLKAQKLNRCYMPFYNQPSSYPLPLEDDEISRWLLQMTDDALACNPRHGYSYYVKGTLYEGKSLEQATEWYLAGLSATIYKTDRLLLAAALLAIENPTKRNELNKIAKEVASSIRQLELMPGGIPDRAEWQRHHLQLIQHGGSRYLQLTNPE